MYGKRAIPGKKRNGLFAKINANNLVKGSCFETPLYDHVPGNKRDSDKDRA
jgi:hypothetical protein